LHEFSFDENQNWEMYLYTYHEIDSLKICSSTEKSTYHFSPDYNQSDILLNNDSLYPNVNINPEGDSITIIFYFPDRYTHESFVETIVFGNYPGANIPKPQKGQSIIRLLETEMGTNYHCICDSSGKFSGNLMGKIYDKDNNVITTGSFNISPFPIYQQCMEGTLGTYGTDVKIDGTYSVNLYSMIYDMNSINICSKKTETSNNCTYYVITDSVAINQLNFTILPDSTVEMDIHLLDDYVGVENIKINSPDILKIFPNPLDDDEIHYEITIPVRSTNCFIQLYNTNGQKIGYQKITDNRGELTLPLHISNGVYILQLWMNGKTYQSKQLIVNR
jgi:hypothetical protein